MTNFTTSWKDGLAFAALVNVRAPVLYAWGLQVCM